MKEEIKLTKTQQKILEIVKQSFISCNPIATKACHPDKTKSYKTAQKHLHLLYRKFGVHSFIQLCCVVMKQWKEEEVQKAIDATKIQYESVPISLRRNTRESAPSSPSPC